MNYVTFLFLLLVVTGLMITAFKLIVAVYSNFNVGVYPRKGLLERIKLLRIHKTLSKLGIDTNQYLHSQTLNVIEQQIRQCETCSSITTCDKELKKSKSDTLEMHFCPNIDALKELGAKAEIVIPVST